MFTAEITQILSEGMLTQMLNWTLYLMPLLLIDHLINYA